MSLNVPRPVARNQEEIQRALTSLLKMPRKVWSLIIKLWNFLNAVWFLLWKNNSPPKIVLVSQSGHGRTLKIARALNIDGIRPVLITENSTYLGHESFDNVLLCSGTLHAFHIAAKHYKGSVFHIICNWNYSLASLMILFKVGKIFIDPFDVLNFFVKQAIKKKYLRQIVLEKWCLTQAHGLVCRDLRTNLLKRNNWILPPRILFMDYIAEPLQESKIKKLGRDIVYLGNVELDPDSNDAYQYGLADILHAHKIRFDFYPSYKEAVRELRLKFAHCCPNTSQSNYLCVHDTVPVVQIPEAISSSSYGLLISSKTINHDRHETYYPIVSRYFFAGKVFDYYESGVFPIAQKGMFVGFVMRRMGVGVTVESYEDITAFIVENENRNVTFKYNMKLTLAYNAPRLNAFYRNSLS